MDGQPNILTPDLDAISRHLGAWAAPYSGTEYEDGRLEIAYTAPGKSAPDRAHLFALDELDEATMFAAERNAERANIYIGAALRTPDADRNKRAGTLDFYAAAFAGIEADEDADAMATRIETLGTNGAIRVRTGQTPQKRVHHWLRLREICDDPEALADALGALVAHVGADAGVKDAARILRLGGTVNWINDPAKTAKGYATELTAVVVEDHPAIDLDRLSALKPMPGWEPEQRGGTGGNGGPGDITRNAEGKVTDGREAFWRQIAMAELANYQRANGADPSADEVFDAAFDRFCSETVGDDRWISGRGQRDLLKRVVNTLRRLRSGHLARFGLYSFETETGRDEAEAAQTKRGAARDASPFSKGFGKASGDDDLAAEIGAATDRANDPVVWPEPDGRLLNPIRPEPPVLPLEDVLRPQAAQWVTASAEGAGAPADYVFLGLLCSVAGVIGNARWVAPWQGWAEPPTLWGIAIGLPSAGKSPAVSSVLSGVHRAEKPIRQAAEKAHEQWIEANEKARMAKVVWEGLAKKALAKGAEPPPMPDAAKIGPEPHVPRLIVHDSTIERLGVIVAEQPKGVLQFRDEIAGWLLGMNARNAGSDRAFWLEAYGGRTFTVERMGRKPLTIDRLSVGVLGGIQPDRLSELLLKTSDDGLLARFMPVWPHPVPVARPQAFAADSVVDAAWAKLLALDMPTDEDGTPRPWFCALDADAKAVMDEWRAQCREWEADAAGLLLSHIGKLPGLAARIALAFAGIDHAFDGAEPPNAITANTFGRACHLIETYSLPMAKRAYAEASVRDHERMARVLLDLIRKEGWQSFTTRDAMRHERTAFASTKTLKPALAVLIEGDCIRQIASTPAPQGGRPSQAFAVNPAVLERKT